ncbi:hypothetical protein ACSLN1_26180, partial [Escherichia coli]|uniref:hypothetical protein n=1 Tax=Escherichia coli TaxID=562 RepID=UPI003EDF3F46
MDIFTDSLTLSVVTTDIRVLAFVALGAGFVVSLIIPAYMNNNINTVHNDFTKNIKRKILTFSVLITFCHHLNDGIF